MTAKMIDKKGMKLLYVGGATHRDVKFIAVFKDKYNEIYVSWSYDGFDFTEPVRIYAERNSDLTTEQRLAKMGGIFRHTQSAINGESQGLVGFDGYKKGQGYIH